MKNKYFVASLVLGMLLPVALAGAKSSEPMDEGQMMAAYMPHPPEKQFEKLGLNPEQKEKIKKIIEDNSSEMKKMHKDISEKMKAFREAYSDNKKTDEDLKIIHSEIEKNHGEIIAQHFNMMLKIRPILNEEQRKKFFENMKKGMKNHKHEKNKEE
ncbi:Spy/CpxP family protein refolding chaperone [Silvanigrella aquatica]|uniref:Zinc resistance-associated protein n=1 Tax=Silvanigrella aquatica TaxID=1915309 RepID=A0A1L4D3L8_9BACT|nr:Spy/CpxP family protein refolding chaperone [Silvanigrella aquatica]APJ04806.1 hypothetical protein AXG55_13215 [Silvanigrella aquatica]